MADIGKNAFEPSNTTMSITPTAGNAWTVNAVSITPPAWDGGDA